MNTKLITVLTIFNTVAVFLLLLISFQKDFLPIYEYKNWTKSQNEENLKHIDSENNKVYDYMKSVSKTCDENVKKAYDHMNDMSKYLEELGNNQEAMMKKIGM